MAIQTGDQVLFVKVDTADDLPATPDDATLYFVTTSKAVYLGANLIANGLVRISDADYQQLTPEQQNNGTLYYRYDATDAGSFDVNVTQSPSTTNADYRILLSGSADDTEHTEGANKSSKFTINPYTGAVTLGTRKSSSSVGNYSFAQGINITASGSVSHAEGYSTIANGSYAHAEGGITTANGSYAHAEGHMTEANHLAQHVFGEWNIADPSEVEATQRGTYVEIVGNGSNSSNRSNARTLDWSGNEVLAGKLTVGAAPTNNMDVATKQYVDDAVTAAIAQVLAAQY